MAEPEDFSALSLPDQFAHKNWKARKGGYETAAKEFRICRSNDPIIRDFTYDSGLWKSACGDSNVAAQQEALIAYNAFLDAAGPEGARKTRGAAMAPIIEKGLIGRPAAKTAATEALLLIIQLDKSDPVIEELLGFLSHKLPKLVAAALSALTTIVHAYGCKIIEPKPIVKILPKVFGHADKSVRAEAQALTVELYRWLREAMKPLFWNELKDVQQKDLEKLFEPVKAEPMPKQERLLQSQQIVEEEAATSVEAVQDEAEDDVDGGFDLEPEYQAVDAFSKIPKDLSDRLASSKWKDRKDVLDETLAAVNVPAIQEGPFDELVRGCAKSMKDANIAVVTVAANVVESLAKGLKKSFAKYRSTILPPMLERFKEKKATVTDALGNACAAVFAAAGLADVQTDLLEALKNKNPQVREHTAKVLARGIQNVREAPTIEQTKELAESCKKLLTESAPTLRDAGCEVLGVLWKVMGDRNMLGYLEGVDETRKTKIKEICDNAEVKTKWKPKSAPPPKSAPGTAPLGRKPALGSKRVAPPAAKRAPPPRAVTPPMQIEEAQPPPKSASRLLSRVPAGPRTPGGGLKSLPASGLQRPGAALKGSTSLASPRRQGMIIEDASVLALAKPGLVPPGRGLAGRPLGKAISQSASPPSSPTPRNDHAAQSALSSVERQELTDLRAELDLLRNACSDLRQDKMRLSSQIAELQNQNAQLIEDHTRDVLQIKAKETQLVRARSDAESAEDRANSLSKEIDRLKREMSRLGRAQSAGRDSPIDTLNGDSFNPRLSIVSRGSSYQVPTARAYGGGGGEGFEGKENMPADGNAAGIGRKLSDYSATQNSRPYSTASSGRQTPALSDDATLVNGVTRNPSEGQESWRRAAEVTQNLKARIEMMKARQNLNRG